MFRAVPLLIIRS